jgi:hypothetical protein
LVVEHGDISIQRSTELSGGRRARLVLAIALVGIVATLLAYAISPGVRRDVSHAAHSVGHVLDRDKKAHTAEKTGGSSKK